MKALVILVLAGVIFGSAAFFTWTLFLKKQHDIVAEKALPPPPPPPDPTLQDFDRLVAFQEAAPPSEAQAAWRDFVDRFPQSTKIDEARERLGNLNTALLFSPSEGPGKSVYMVKANDVITRVAAHEKSTPELIMMMNNMSGSMLRIGQKLVVAPSDFSVIVDRKRQKVQLLRAGKFFKQYDILTMPAQKAAPPGQRLPKIAAHVSEKVAFRNGARIIFTDKGYMDADHWIVVTPAGHSLFGEIPAGIVAPVVQKPPGGGYGLSSDAMRELAAVLRKNDPVTIE